MFSSKCKETTNSSFTNLCIRRTHMHERGVKVVAQGRRGRHFVAQMQQRLHSRNLNMSSVATSKSSPRTGMRPVPYAKAPHESVSTVIWFKGPQEQQGID